MTKKPRIGQQLDEKLDSIDRIEATVTDLKDDMKSLKDDMKSLKDDMNGMKDDMNGMKDDMNGMKDDMKSLIGAFNENTRSIQSALSSKGIPVKLTTAKAKRAGKATG